MTTRLDLPTDSELDPITIDKLHKLPNLNIAKMLARTGALSEFYSIVEKIFNPEYFPELDREIMLFRTCQQNSSTYEIAQRYCIQ